MLAGVWAGALGGVALSVAWIDGAAAAVRAAPTWRSAGSRCIASRSWSRGCRSRRCCCSLAGGLLYSAGAVVYATQRPDPWPRMFGFHEVFHALVIAAAVTHFVAMAGWVIPAA